MAAETAGLFDELGTGWLLFDTEIMPWSAKAQQRLRNQDAAAGAAARASVDTASEVLAAVAARGQDIGDLRARMSGRAADIDAFTRTYGRYCWPVDGLAGLRVAPFGLLAGEGANYATRGRGRFGPFFPSEGNTGRKPKTSCIVPLISGT